MSRLVDRFTKEDFIENGETWQTPSASKGFEGIDLLSRHAGVVEATLEDLLVKLRFAVCEYQYQHPCQVEAKISNR